MAFETAAMASPALSWTSCSLRSQARWTTSNQFGGRCGLVASIAGLGAEDARALRAAERTSWFDLSERVEGCRLQTASKTCTVAAGQHECDSDAQRRAAYPRFEFLRLLTARQSLRRFRQMRQAQQHAVQAADVLLDLLELLDLYMQHSVGKLSRGNVRCAPAPRSTARPVPPLHLRRPLRALAPIANESQHRSVRRPFRCCWTRLVGREGGRRVPGDIRGSCVAMMIRVALGEGNE